MKVVINWLLHVSAGLQNDHKSLMKEIEVLLHEVHAEAREAKESNGETKMDTSEAPSELRKPFATVDKVDNNSPAESSVSMNWNSCISV